MKKLKDNSDIFESFICSFFNDCVDKGKVPPILKFAIITPFFKKEYRGSKDSYRSVSILSVISKIFENLLCKQIILFIDPLLSRLQCGFRRGYGSQDYLLAMLEHWKSELDRRKVFGELLTYLSKAFDCLPHGRMIAKLNAHRFSLSALKVVQNLPVKKTIKNQNYSILQFMGGNSLWCSRRFDTGSNDLFLVIKDANFHAIYADDNTIHKSGTNVDDVINGLQVPAQKAFLLVY